MRRYLTLVTVIMLVMGAGMAVALVGDDGVIHACARNWTGALRLVDDPDECGRWETPVSWNEQGVPGLDGADGLDGSPGLDGNLALANQVCEEEGASVIGFDADADIICQVGGATTTTTTTTTEPPVASEEVCNGVDDDLNGVIDDHPVDLPDDGQAATEASCISGVWVFAIAEWFCLIGGMSYHHGDQNPADPTLVCDSQADPEAWSPRDAEVCDGVDNDLNGLIDEGLGPYCLSGVPAASTDGDSLCLGGFFDFDGDPANGCEFAPSPEVCDGLDNDLDGNVDENWPVGEACSAAPDLDGMLQCAPDQMSVICVPA